MAKKKTRAALREAIGRAVDASGLTPFQWAEQVAGLPKSTFRTVMQTGTASGATLAKLQRAGVNVADRKLIDSLDSGSAAA